MLFTTILVGLRSAAVLDLQQMRQQWFRIGDSRSQRRSSVGRETTLEVICCPSPTTIGVSEIPVKQ